MTEALYLSPNTPTFKVKVGREKLQALKGVLRCPAHLVAELDALIAKRQDVKANLKKIDMKKAEETVREHQAKERKQGVAGPFASDNGNKATLRAERDKLRASGNATTDPETGKEEFIFSCYNQDQELDRVDFNNLQARLRQNSVQEKLSNLWFEHLLDQAESELVHV